MRAGAAGKVPLIINLDETSVGYACADLKGNIARQPRGQAPLGAQIPRKELRGAITHVALITENTEIQPCLPQVLIGNRHRFTLGLMAEAMTHKPANVHLFREKTAWNTGAVMVRILELLAAALARWPHVQPILLLDTASCHLQRAVLRKASDLGIYLCAVPAGLTWLLQPLDTHVFAGYKSFLRAAYLNARTVHGTVSPERWLRLIFQVSTVYLSSRNWSRAFAALGLHGPCEKLSRDLQIYFPTGRVAAALPILRPSSDAISKILPRGHRILFFWWVKLPAGLRRRLLLL